MASVGRGIRKALRRDAAVLTAKRVTKSGDIVLFSPASASFDMFRSYEHRGEVFKQYVLSK